MELEKIVILMLAIMFFGGIGYLVWKSRQEDKQGAQTSSSATPDRIEGDPSNKSQEKERRISKS
jgi:Flp pilus assembly protein CpaB